MKRQRFYILGIIAGLLVTGVWFFGLNNKELTTTPYQDQGPENFDPKAEEQWWSNTIERRSSTKAYETFKQTYKSLSLIEKHTLSHVFGSALYTTVGLVGIGVCDYNFSSGCDHEFLGLSLLEHGLPVIEELDSYCQKRGAGQMGCQHGIGHGLVVFFGYDQLEEALKQCDRLEVADIYINCHNGAFMEYNLHTMEEENALRPLNIEAPDQLCREIDSAYTLPCYYELALWWLHHTEYDFVEVARMCNQVADLKGKNACLWGLGISVVGINSLDTEIILPLCSEFAGVSYESYGYCLKALAIFYEEAGDIDAIDNTCAPLADDTYWYRLCTNPSL